MWLCGAGDCAGCILFGSEGFGVYAFVFQEHAVEVTNGREPCGFRYGGDRFACVSKHRLGLLCAKAHKVFVWR